MADLVKLIFAKPIHLAIQVIIIARESTAVYFERCAEIESKTDNLLDALRQAAKASPDLYERPTRVIIDKTNHVLEKAHALVLKCQRTSPFWNRVFTIVRISSFRKISEQLEYSTAEVSWLLWISTSNQEFSLSSEKLLTKVADGDTMHLYSIWRNIALLFNGSQDLRSGAAESLVKLCGNSLYRNRIIEEGGVAPLLKLVKDGNPQGQENAVRVIGLLGKDPEDVLHLIHAGVCSIFTDILNKGPMKVQVMVAWALSELAGNCPKCQDLFAQHDCISLLVGHLELETVDQEQVGAATRGSETVDQEINGNDIDGNAATKGLESEDTATKNSMKAMAARALWCLAIDNVSICHRITESNAMSCFAVLLEKGTRDQQYSSAMALMEITAMVEKDTDLGSPAFKLNSPIREALVDQLFNIINNGESELLIPCVKSIGNLARTCRATETRMISPLVRLLGGSGYETSVAALVVLTKAVCHENYRCVDHSKAILSAGAPAHLIELVNHGKIGVKIPAMILLSYISLHVPAVADLEILFIGGL